MKKEKIAEVGSVKELTFGDITQDDLAGSGTWEQENNAFMDSAVLKGLFFNEDWVFLAVDLVAEHASSSPMQIYEESIQNGEYTKEEVNDHPLYNLFNRPNPFQDYYSWQYNAFVEYCLMGNIVEWVNDSNSISIVIPSETIMLDFDRDGNLDGYIVNRSAHEANLQEAARGDLVRFDKDEIMHLMRPNPASLLWGLSPFIAPRKSVLYNRYTQDYINNFYLKGATPGMVLEMDQNVNEKSALRFLRSFEVANTGRRNNRRTLILPKGVRANVVTPTLADQAIIEMSESNQHKILSALKIPKHAFSLAQAGSLGSEEHKQALRFFFKSAIIPIQNKRAAHLTMKMRERGVLTPTQCIEFDNSHVDFLQDDMAKKAELGNLLKEQWTLNEIRQELWSKEPLPEGDVVLSPLLMTPQFPQLPQFSLPENHGDIRLQVSPQDPQAIEDGCDHSKNIDYEISNKELEDRRRMRSMLDTNFKDYITQSQKSMGREVQNKEADILELFLTRFLTQVEKAIIPAVRKELEKMPTVKEKADGDKPAKINKRRLRKEIDKAIDELSKQANERDLEVYDELLTSTVEASYGVLIQPTFNATDIQALEAIRQRGKNNRRETLAARGLETFKNIDRTTTNRVMSVIERGIEQNKTIGDIQEAILETVGKAAVRAETIARTEVLTAVSLGKQAAVKDMQEVFEGEDIVKIWLTADDSRVRDTHRPLDGATIPVDEAFDNGLDYPRDVTGEPGEVINCFVGDTQISALDIRKCYRRIYEGNTITIKTEIGKSLTCTPNHPMLTKRGWVAARELNTTDELIHADVLESCIGSDHKVATRNTKFTEFYNSFSVSFSRIRRSGTRNDFHGDGINQNIDIVCMDGSLLNDSRKLGSDSFSSFVVKNTNITKRFMFKLSRLNKGLSRVLSPSRIVSSLDLIGPLFFGHFTPFSSLGLASAPPSQPQSMPVVGRAFSTNSEFFRDFFDANEFVNVRAVKIKELSIRKFSGYVYNLHTGSNKYLANGFINHNCRCDFMAMPKKDLDRLSVLPSELANENV